MRSGVPMCHASSSGNTGGGGRSAGLPRGAPASDHAAIVAISASVSDGSSLNCWMPTLRSMCQGGMMRSRTRVLMARAQGRTSS